MSMEKQRCSFVKNCVSKLPPGFRFHPTDEELVVQYLKRKALSYPLPASVITEVDYVCQSDPWDLPGDKEQEMYFFSTTEVKYPNGNRSNRATGSGYWKATGLDKKIMSKQNEIVGMKKTLVFYSGKPPKGLRTDWIMHEYRLFAPLVQAKRNWVLCRVFLKKRNNKSTPGPGLECSGPVFYDFMARDQRVLSSNLSSGSSDVTDVNSKRNENLDDHEENNSSSCNSFRRN